MPIGTLTVRNVPVVVRSLLASRGADVSNLRNNRIIAAIDTALETLGYRVARGPDYQRLQATFIGVPLGGALTQGNLATASGRPILDIARMSIRETISGVRLVPIDSLQVFQYGDLPLGPIYYVVDGLSLRFRDTSGALDQYNAEVSIIANYVPTLTGVPSVMQGAFFNTLAGILSEPQPEGRAMEIAHG